MSIFGIKFNQSTEDDEHKLSYEEDIILNTQSLNQRMVSSIQISGKQAIAIYSATREQQRQVSKLVMELLVKTIHIDTVPDPPKNPTNIRQPQYFLLAEQQLNKTPADLSKRWEINNEQAALTLKATTQKLVRRQL